jgi:hypothetical protein
MEYKENIRPEFKDSQNRYSALASRNRGFGKLLDAACKDTREEEDSKYAMNVQCKDITNVINALCSDFEREQEGKSQLS